MGQTTLIRQVLNIQLLYEAFQRMYVLTDGTHHSLWFDEHEKEELMALNDNDFVVTCEGMLQEDGEL
jgi:hypothetical protein